MVRRTTLPPHLRLPQLPADRRKEHRQQCETLGPFGRDRSRRDDACCKRALRSTTAFLADIAEGGTARYRLTHLAFYVSSLWVGGDTMDVSLDHLHS